MPTTSINPPEPRSGRILIVEALTAAAAALVDELKSLGYFDCDVAQTREEALLQVATRHPNLVLIDSKLERPDDGFDVAYDIAQVHQAGTIFVSTSAGDEHLKRALDGLPFSCIASPFNAERLKKAIDETRAFRANGEGGVRELAELATRDRATGLHSRSFMQRAIEGEWDRCARDAAPLGLMLVQFDVASPPPSVFAELGSAMQAHCMRTRDAVARWDSDCLAALMPDTQPAGAHHVAGRVVEAARQLQNPDLGGQSLTASVGLASIAPTSHDGPEALVGMAQRALAAARAKGGNCVQGTRPPETKRTIWEKIKSALTATEPPSNDQRGAR